MNDKNLYDMVENIKGTKNKAMASEKTRIQLVVDESGYGRITIDGAEIPNVYSVTIEAAAGEATRVSLGMIAVDVELDVTTTKDKVRKWATLS